MTSTDVAKVAVQAAHVDGMKKGVSKVTGVSVFGVSVVVLAAVGAIAFFNYKAGIDREDAVYDAENKAFSHGVDVTNAEIARVQAQKSRVVVI